MESNTTHPGMFCQHNHHGVQQGERFSGEKPENDGSDITRTKRASRSWHEITERKQCNTPVSCKMSKQQRNTNSGNDNNTTTKTKRENVQDNGADVGFVAQLDVKSQNGARSGGIEQKIAIRLKNTTLCVYFYVCVCACVCVLRTVATTKGPGKMRGPHRLMSTSHVRPVGASLNTKTP